MMHKRWEYKTLRRDRFAPGVGGSQRFEDEINAYGKQGWRMLEATYRSSQYTQTTVIMEREIPFGT